MVLPGEYSVIVPLPSVVVVVVVVSETCPHANGATTAKAMVKSIFLIISLSLCCYGDKSSVFRVTFWPGEELAATLNSHPRRKADVFDKLFYGA